MENLYAEKCIRTFTGKYVNVFEPDIGMIDIIDIAHSLSMQCRFNGHLPIFYSVARHSIECSKKASNRNKLAALLHDASEAYLCDLPGPIKHHIGSYREIESNLMTVIAEKFQIEYPFDPEIKKIDNLMLEWEWENIMISKKITIDPKTDMDKWAFLQIFNDLIK